MKTFEPTDPKFRIEFFDVLRGFALCGIIFNNMQYLSGYSFTPFYTMKQIVNLQLNESFYHLLDIIITAKFYTLFSFLFATGFYIQLSRHIEETVDFLKIYRRRLWILLVIGAIHGLIWFGDILFSYALMGFVLILFRNLNPKNILRCAICVVLLPFLIDLAALPFYQPSGINNLNHSAQIVHVSYPDMTPEDVIKTYQNGSIFELLKLNFHNLIWINLAHIPSGQIFILWGIFLLGYYLASTGFFTKNSTSISLLIISLIIGIVSTILARLSGGSLYRWPPTPSNILFKLLLLVGQIFLCVSYIIVVKKIFTTSFGKKVLRYLIPMGRMALTNYLFQSLIMICIFYNFGFKLFGRVGLIQTSGIVVIILLVQIIFSNIWLRYFKFGPFEWLWRSLTYRKMIKIRIN